ncbi:Eco57I restriction-modification methylase domain-containing protein [Peptoniphilus sp. SGI.035]|uniref:Eco57I restriction-modification methylase domain-containing protein n=1 Tax=Peptoniphilus sp. SGI.035 TaxID=3420564 RepID=UPI003D04D37B
MSKIIDFNLYPIMIALKNLLKDKSTKKNIIWATNIFEHLGREFDDKREITDHIFKNGFRLMPRVEKSEEAQLNRTRKRAEVFTPGWIVNEMNNYLDEEWFGRKNVFNIERGESWETVTEKINFPKDKNWEKYILSRRLEITCGEAPYLVSRYDVSTGEKIEIINRIGILDRKLRIVNENTFTKEEWIKWAIKAVESTYGFEYQGDNLLIARINILMTFVEYFEDRWKEEVDKKTLRHLANIISWNIWQMDGLTDMVPFGAVKEDIRQMNFFDLLSGGMEEEDGEESIYCRIRNWREDSSKLFTDYKEHIMKKFDFVIGNPPYQDKAIGTSTSDDPIYHLFMDQSFRIASKACFITPARFLFNAGKTPKNWNKKMLNDEHFKVEKFIQKSSDVFRNTDIKGGVAITYRDKSKNFGAIGTFTSFDELNSIRNKVVKNDEFVDIMGIINNQSKFNLDVLYEDFPKYRSIIGSDGRDKRLRQIIMERLEEIFTENKADEESYKILGLINKKRAYRYVPKKYIEDNEVINKYKVLLPSANGSGAIGEVLSTPLIGEPLIGYTQTFIAIGLFDNEIEAENCLKYIKSKFARTMLGILKITQGNNRDTWANVPMQDFTNKSDIDWSKSIPEIDRQLYAKYKLSQEEIDFIEKNVKEME